MKKRLVILAAGLVLTQFSNGAFAQQAASGAWGGWARCQITVQGPGYNDRQTHTWTITGGAPTAQGGFQIYSGTWAVVGGGSLSRTQAYQTLVAQWATNATETNAPLAVFVRASDNRMFIQARHSQLRTAAAVQGYQQVTISGTPQKPVNMATAAFEWQFPVIVVSPPVAPNTNATATGSSSSPVNGSVGPMQPGGSQGTASCTWQFGQGSAAPAPPPPLAAQPVPTPGSPATTTPPANNPPASSVPPASSTPPANPPVSPPPADNPAPPLTATPLDPVLLPLPVFCSLRGPSQAAAANNYATPGAAHLDWEPVAGATGYTVSRSDLGVVTAQPLATSVTSYVHRAKLPHPATYVYKITANYQGGGCGSTDITLNSTAPATPNIYHRLGAQAGEVKFTWNVSPSAQRLLGDFTGVVITGPGLPPEGRQVLQTAVFGNQTVVYGVPPGSSTWRMKAFWDTPTGRLIDDSGTSITLTMP